jgi:UDP-N-acetylmuramyl pentapeptide phosphotransferase/UDP-N-acetylglucosamine-1-phosphate transferase
LISYLYITLLLVIAILAYFRIAARFGIVDVPNHRSSHQEVTIRGAGIIFPLSILLCRFVFGDISVFLITGLLLISTISFVDDLSPLSARIRMSVHVIAVSLMLYALNMYTVYPWYAVVCLYIIIIGGINAYNFMDGINGITGIYSGLALVTMLYINYYISPFTKNALIVCPLLACMVFLYFNFRGRAKCFAGDVGSISIAFWLIALSVMLVLKLQSYKYLFLFSVYGVDVFFTVIKRIKLKQNIFEAHRLHIYQLLVNNGRLSHRGVALLYGAVQLIINIFVITTSLYTGVYAIVIIAFLGSMYIIAANRFGRAYLPV